jgi:phosphohistidine phosphatase
MTRRLILMRHAKSDWAFDVPDQARGLNERGRRSAEALGDWLRAEGHLPDQTLCSSAVRTRQTLDLLQLESAVHLEDLLYHADPHTVLRMLHHAEGRTVLLVGHNPGLQEVATRLVAQPAAHPKFAQYPSGATLVADFTVSDWADLGWGAGRVVDFVVPRDLL